MPADVFVLQQNYSTNSRPPDGRLFVRVAISEYSLSLSLDQRPLNFGLGLYLSLKVLCSCCATIPSVEVLEARIANFPRSKYVNTSVVFFYGYHDWPWSNRECVDDRAYIKADSRPYDTRELEPRRLGRAQICY